LPEVKQARYYCAPLRLDREFVEQLSEELGLGKLKVKGIKVVSLMIILKIEVYFRACLNLVVFI
jgi:hypothetical protein